MFPGDGRAAGMVPPWAPLASTSGCPGSTCPGVASSPVVRAHQRSLGTPQAGRVPVQRCPQGSFRAVISVPGAPESVQGLALQRWRENSGLTFYLLKNLI